ncbi:hypothetical protein [Streptomyces sp. NPDC052042]|uniref:hypothetical protein n=1 Tax=Streptomyces sp. NPDC052042 TaxID=3365683 RepID=UPI0037D4A5EF
MTPGNPREVHLVEPVAPRPYPGCDVCIALTREWIAVTDPASVSYSLTTAYRLVDEIAAHRDQDETRAPV